MRAQEIKEQFKAEFEKFNSHPMMDKAVAFILSIDNQDFWIESEPNLAQPISIVMELAQSGLLIEGSCGNKIAKMSQEDGEIVISSRN